MPRVWNIHEQIAKILTAADGDDHKELEAETDDFQCSNRKDTVGVITSAVHQTMHIVGSCLEEESYKDDSDLNEKVSSGIEGTRKAAKTNAKQDKESFILNEPMNRPFASNNDLRFQKENQREDSEDVNGVITHSIEPAIHGEDLSGLLDKTLELEEHCLDIRNSFESMWSELRNERLEKTDNDRRNSEVNYGYSIVRRDADPIESCTFIKALAEAEGNSTGVIKEAAFPEDLSLFIAKTIVNESLSYGMRIKELDERLSKELLEWNKNIAKLGSEAENERKEKIKVLDALDKKEKRIELIMNELNTKVGSLEMLRESERQCKRRLKGLTTQNKKKEAKLANLRKEMGKKIKENKELETVCLDLTTSCDTLVEKCRKKDENLRSLEANLKQTLDEATIIKNRLQSQERNVSTLLEVIARMLAESSIRFACQSIELSREKDRIEKLESTIHLQAQEKYRYLNRYECYSNSMVNDDRQAKAVKNDCKPLPINICNDGLDAVAEDSFENVTRCISNDLHSRIKNREEQRESTESRISCINIKSLVCSKQCASKNYVKEDGFDVECGNLAALIVDQCMNIAVKTLQVKSYMASIQQNPHEEFVNCSKLQLKMREVRSSNHSLQYEHKDWKEILERVVATLNRISKEYFESFLEVESNSTCQLKLERNENLRQNCLMYIEKCISETGPPFTHISPGMGNTIAVSKNSDIGDVDDSVRDVKMRPRGERKQSKKPKTVFRGKAEEEGVETSFLCSGGVNFRQSQVISETEAQLEKMRRLVAKYVLGIAVSRALVQLGVGEEDILKYYVDEGAKKRSPSHAISLEKEGDDRKKIKAVTALNDEHGRKEEQQQQQKVILSEEYEPLLMHEMGSSNDTIFGFRTAKIMQSYSQLCDEARSCSADSSELGMDNCSLEYLISSFEQGIDGMGTPLLSEGCFSFVKLVMVVFADQTS